ncbi:MAG: hypothetical protein PHE88_04535 [Elusimicrobia bacterium]|nr:hypothetical protein [Elusimicrobiota bacterium]
MIKSFKIELRQGYIFRELKKRKVEVSEEELSEKVKEIQKCIKPATVYDSFNPAIFQKKIDFGKSVAFSLFAVTLGKEVEALEKSDIVEASLMDGLEVAKHFVLKLVQIEAEQEHCELLEVIKVEPQKVFENQKILNTIEFSKVDIKYEAETVSPEYTRFFAVGWVLKRKR